MRKANAFAAVAIRAAAAGIICLTAERPAIADAPVSFELARGHSIIVPVFVGGTGPFDFLLDTGSNVTMITPQLARSLAIRPTHRVAVQTVAGMAIMPYSILPSLTLGPRTEEQLDAIHSELTEIRSRAPAIQGVLGQNFLARFNYTLSYSERRIEFDSAPETAVGERLPIEQRGGRLIVTAGAASSTSRRLKLVLDSGVSRLILFEIPGRSLDVDLERTERFVTGSTSAGDHTFRMASLRTLYVGSMRLSHLPVAIAGARPGPEDEFGSGLLPTSIFDRIFFNHHAGYIVVNARSVHTERRSEGLLTR